MGNQASGAREIAQGPGYVMVESSEQQIAGGSVDGTFTHKTAAFAAGAGQIERLRAHLRRMATEVQTSDGGAEIWRMATQTYRENELQDPQDVHWKALTVLDKLHKRDRRNREKEIAEYAKEASKGAMGLVHHLTKPRAVLVPGANASETHQLDSSVSPLVAIDVHHPLHKTVFSSCE